MNEWKVLEGVHPGYLGKEKDNFFADLDAKYGSGNWKIAWQLADGEILDYIRVVYEIFAASYAAHFRKFPDEQNYLTENFAFTFDKDLIDKAAAFDPWALYEKPGRVNQIHHVGINLAVERINGVQFKGEKPLQVREGKPGTAEETWPEGWKLSPGRVFAIRPDLIPEVNEASKWDYRAGSIEERYQKSKVIQVLSN